MVIIAITNIPPMQSLKAAVRTISPLIQGQFEVLNFTHSKDGIKTLYIRLPEKQSIKDVIKRINTKQIETYQLKAFIPDNVADLPVPAKPPPKIIPKELLTKALDGIMAEMQSKYPRLHRVSEYSQHELLERIGRIVFKRLKNIVANPSYSNETSFQLTKTYRHTHPHATDYQFIMENFHSVQDAQGKPRTNPQEKNFMSIPLVNLAFNHISYDILDQLCQHHIARMTKQLVNHVKGLEVKEETSTPEEAATMKVRKHLKDLAQYLPGIYGEPYLPNKDSMAPFTQHFQPITVSRSDYMYNLLSLRVPREMFPKILQADGAIVKRAKLVIRPGKLPFYKVTRYQKDAAGVSKPLPAEGQGTTEDQVEEEDMDCSDSC